MTIDEIHVGSVVTGPLPPEPVGVLAIVRMGDSIKLIGMGVQVRPGKRSVAYSTESRPD